jgi:hypothetical protein
VRESFFEITVEIREVLMSIAQNVRALTINLKSRSGLGFAILVLHCFAALWPSATHAQDPVVALKRYDYRYLSLLEISKSARGKLMACFFGASARGTSEYAWVSEKSEISSRIAAVHRIHSDRVEIEETISVNGVDWVLAKFEWPLASDSDSRQLKKGCGKPPK